MSKLQIKPKAGYTKSQSSTNPAMYPNTTVESVYWEKEHMTLEEALRNGGGGGSIDVQTEMPEDGFAPNTFYNLGTITENMTFLMAEGEEGKANHYFWVFETGADVPEITWPEGIRLWEDSKAPVIAANHHYEISVYDGVGMYEVIGEGGGGEDPSDVVKVTPQTLSYEQQMQARGNLGLYGSYDFTSYGEASLVDVNSSTTAALFGVARKNSDGTYTELEYYDDIISAIPTYEEIDSNGGIYVGDEFVDSYEKMSELTTCIYSNEYDICITLGSDRVPSGYSSGDFVFNAPGIYVIQGDETTPNQNVAWSKDVKVPSKYVPDVDLTNKKIPGVIYLDVAHARSMMSGPSELNITRARVAELFNITRDEVQELFLTSGIYLHHTTFLAIKDNNGNNNDIWYYDKYQILVDHLFTPNEPTPIISNEGDGRKLLLGQPDTPGYVQVEIKLLDRTSLLSGFNVSITAPD